MAGNKRKSTGSGKKAQPAAKKAKTTTSRASAAAATKTATPEEETPAVEVEVEREPTPLPSKVGDSKALPTLSEPQHVDLPDDVYQSIGARYGWPKSTMKEYMEGLTQTQWDPGHFTGAIATEMGVGLVSRKVLDQDIDSQRCASTAAQQPAKAVDEGDWVVYNYHRALDS